MGPDQLRHTIHTGADPGGGLGGLQPPVLSPEPGKYHGKRAQSRAELPTIPEIPGIYRL